MDRTVHLRFAKAGGAAPAIAVERVDENGCPVALPPDPAIWLVPLDMAAATTARQIRNNLMALHGNDVAARSRLRGVTVLTSSALLDEHLRHQRQPSEAIEMLSTSEKSLTSTP